MKKRAIKVKTIDRDDYRIRYAGSDDEIHVDIRTDKGMVSFSADPDEAYVFANTILRCYDHAVGIAELPPLKDY